MFIEKFSRFFRVYELRFSPKHGSAPHLPLINPEDEFSVLDALKKRIDAEKALEVQSNGDIVELMNVEHDQEKNALVLLFHRASPDAAEPAYRKKAREAEGKKVTVRASTKEEGEEQSVSAHLIISLVPKSQGVYRSALEEIPGVSMSSVKRVIGKALYDYPYQYAKKKEVKATYCVFRPEGVKSETMTNALKDGYINYVTLTRQAAPDFVDAGGMFQPMREEMKLRVVGEITPDNWREKFGRLLGLAKNKGWEDFNIEINLPDKRSRTIKMEKDEEAKEILFVKSELAAFKEELPACTTEVIKEVIDNGLKVIQKANG